MRKKINRMLCWILTPIILLALVAYYKVDSIPSVMFIREGNALKESNFIKLKEQKGINVGNFIDKNGCRKLNVSILGLIPVKSINVRTVSPQITLYPGGQPVGVKLNTKGALVVALCDIESENLKITSPAAEVGIQIGDSIIKINGETVNNSEDVARLINANKGKDMNVVISRKGSEMVKKIKPVKSTSDNSFKIGLWVRDSTAGVGTLTFYDENTKKFAALGHPITDVDTGTILSINSGEIVSSSIVSVRKGVKGSPGELKGIFVDEDNKIGDINKNTGCGIFGESDNELKDKCYAKPMKIALRDEIKAGNAKVLTTVDGNEPKFYDIVIEKLLSQDTPGPKSMVIRVTDPELLAKTGGIVQGMSGSPIIQDNKIIGAVTHVLINKPDTGYGIYIEWMLRDAEVLSK